MNPNELVESGYDKIQQSYHNRRVQGFWDNISELDAFTKLLPKGGSVLDIGCGSGHIALILEREGFTVTGIDVSRKMLGLAKKYSPTSKFARMDMRKLEFPPKSFDGITCFYSMIHVPRVSHRQILRRFWKVLKTGGVLAIHMGWSDWVAVGPYIDGTPMYWSYYDKETNLMMLRDVGFHIELSKADVQKDGGTHLFVLARKM